MATEPLDYQTRLLIWEEATTLRRKGAAATRTDALHALIQVHPDDHRYLAAALSYAKQKAPGTRVPVTKAAGDVAEASAPWNELMTYAQVKLELGEVDDILAGLAQAAQEHPELRAQYETAQLACLSGTARPEADATIPPPETQESDMPPVKGALTKDTPSAPQAATAAWLDQIAKCQREQPTLTYQQASDLAYLENRHLYQLAVEEQRWPQPSLPSVGKQAEMTDETIHKMVDAALAQDPDQSTMQAWQQVLKNHEGQPTFGPIYKRYRRWVLSDGLEAHDVAALAKARARK